MVSIFGLQSNDWRFDFLPVMADFLCVPIVRVHFISSNGVLSHVNEISNLYVCLH